MRLLITAGPTHEYFDSVRFISNPSSGKMGYAIAGEALQRGHRVHLVSGPVAIPDPAGAVVQQVTSAAEMFEVCVKTFAECDAAIMTAAVCDYRPVERLQKKLKKTGEMRTIRLEPTQDICAHLGSIKERRVVVGFAMEDHDHRAHAVAKLQRKQCDAIMLNDIENVASDQAKIEILEEDGTWSGVIAGSKVEVARVIVEVIERIFSSRVR